MIKELDYYFKASYRRKELDKLQERHRSFYAGDVLDIGGRDRGKFKKPKNQVNRWIFGDIKKKHNPDIVLDVSNMGNIANETFDTVSAIELFEHVAEPEKGIAECRRILKKNGTLILSCPFLYPVHADPWDFQRWTKEKWKHELKKNGFEIIVLEKNGLFFSVLSESFKFFNRSFGFFRFFGYLFYPLLDLVASLDKVPFFYKNKILSSFTTGYFIISKKQ